MITYYQLRRPVFINGYFDHYEDYGPECDTLELAKQWQKALFVSTHIFKIEINEVRVG